MHPNGGWPPAILSAKGKPFSRVAFSGYFDFAGCAGFFQRAEHGAFRHRNSDTILDAEDRPVMGFDRGEHFIPVRACIACQPDRIREGRRIARDNICDMSGAG